MAVGTSGYIENIHTKAAPIAPPNLGGVQIMQALVSGASKIYDYNQEINNGKLLTEYNKGLIPLTTAGKNAQETHLSIQDYNKKFFEQYPDLSTSLVNQIGKVELDYFAKASQEKTDNNIRNLGAGIAAGLVNSNITLTDAEHIIETSPFDKAVVSSQVSGAVVQQMILNTQETSKNGSVDMLLAQENKNNLIVDALKTNPKFLGNMSEKGTKEALVKLSLYESEMDKIKRNKADEVSVAINSIITPTNVKDYAASVEKLGQVPKLLTDLRKLGNNSTADVLENKYNKQLTLLVETNKFNELTKGGITNPLSAEAYDFLKTAENGTKFKQMYTSTIMNGLGKSLDTFDFESAKSIIDANADFLPDVKKAYTNMLTSVKDIKQLEPFIQAYVGLGAARATNIFGDDAIELMSVAPVLSQLTNKDGTVLTMSELKDRIRDAKVNPTILSGNQKETLHNKIVDTTSSIKNPIYRKTVQDSIRLAANIAGDVEKIDEVASFLKDGITTVNDVEVWNPYSGTPPSETNIAVAKYMTANALGIKEDDIPDNYFMQTTVEGGILVSGITAGGFYGKAVYLSPEDLMNPQALDAVHKATKDYGIVDSLMTTTDNDPIFNQLPEEGKQVYYELKGLRERKGAGISVDILGTKEKQLKDKLNSYINPPAPVPPTPTLQDSLSKPIINRDNIISTLQKAVKEDGSIDKFKYIDLINKQVDDLDSKYGGKMTAIEKQLTTESLYKQGLDMVKEQPKATETYSNMIAGLEGTTVHKDIVGNNTLQYGIVNDMKNNPRATEANREAAKSLGYNLDNLTQEQAKQVSDKVMTTMENTLAKEVPNWNMLDETSRIFMLDAKYNTGKTFEKLPVALEKYQNDKTWGNLYDVVKEARRGSKGSYTRGLDNRVAKLLYNVGLINSVAEAVKLGLDKATLIE